MAEISNDKAIAIATFFSWVGTLIISATTNSLMNKWTKEWTFMIFGAINVFSCLFCLCFLKETKGKSLEERMALYNKGEGKSVVENRLPPSDI